MRKKKQFGQCVSYATNKPAKLVREPREEGSGPLNSFSYMKVFSKLSSDPNDGGMVPVRSFALRAIFVRRLSDPSAGGMVPCSDHPIPLKKSPAFATTKRTNSQKQRMVK